MKQLIKSDVFDENALAVTNFRSEEEMSTTTTVNNKKEFEQLSPILAIKKQLDQHRPEDREKIIQQMNACHLCSH